MTVSPAYVDAAPTVAALYVDPNGVYANLPGVEVWDEARDARLYAGPWPVVAHPPCARWSRLAGFTEARFGYKRGEDGGCFAAALEAVRTFGGVIEHPAFSKAFDAYGLPEPLTYDGWTGGLDGGWACYVEQGRYGLPVKKATWLYAYGVDLPDLEWGLTPDGDGEEPNGEYGGIDNWRGRWHKPKEGAHPRALSGAWRVNRHNGCDPPPRLRSGTCSWRWRGRRRPPTLTRGRRDEPTSARPRIHRSRARRSTTQVGELCGRALDCPCGSPGERDLAPDDG